MKGKIKMRHCMMNSNNNNGNGLNNYNNNNYQNAYNDYPPLPPYYNESVENLETNRVSQIETPAMPSDIGNTTVDVTTVTPPAPSLLQPVPGTYSIEGPPQTFDKNYLPGYLRTKLNSIVRLEFLLGTSTYTDRTGVLVDVGNNYVTLRDLGTRNLVICDLYSIRFVNVYNIDLNRVNPSDLQNLFNMLKTGQ